MGHCLFLRKGSVHTKPASLPSGYTKLAYIQSTGTQYVDTGVVVNKADSVRMVLDTHLTSNDSYGGCNGYMQFQSSVGGGVRSTIDVSYSNTTETVTVNGEQKSSQSWASYNGENVKLGIFKMGDANNSWFSGAAQIGKLYSCKIYDNGTLIRDYVPCKDPSGAVGLYDLTGEQFYGNGGTGVFYAGPPVVTLPEGYTQLMYLESSGTQYINTGFTPNQDARIQLDCERTAANATDHFFGVRTGNSASSAFAFYIYNSGWRWAYNNATASGTGPDIGRYFIDANKNITTINGDTTLTGTYASFTAAAAAPLFAMLSAPSGFSYGSFRLYTCRIYNNGLMVRDFIPCRNASGTIGLYDLVNGQFYTNAGTGAFTAGEVE